MKVTAKWIREFVPGLTATPEEIARRLTGHGLEVESVTSLAAGFDKVVVGKLLEVKKHPTATKPLTVCSVDTGDATPRQIVCGAQNHKAGDLVAVALPGAKLPNGMAINKGKLAGEVSDGMLCSLTELKLGQPDARGGWGSGGEAPGNNAADGIIILPADATVGAPVAKVLGVDDAILEVAITPNRGDCLSVIGLSREVAAAFDLPLEAPYSFSEVSNVQASTKVKLFVDDAKGCPRYVARVIDGVKVGPSPSLIARRLEQCGIRPINNVVDATNYVMLETGQPLHAFDARFLRGGAITVRAAKVGETLKTLDGVTHKLEPSDLVIADDGGPVALAGVMGGEHSGIQDDTTCVILESAHFDPSRVRKTARRLGMHTDSSHRFERTVDPTGVDRASMRAAGLIAETGKGKLLAGEVEQSAQEFPPREVTLSLGRVNALLGFTIGDIDAAKILAKIHLEARPVDTGRLLVTVPRFRADISTEVDLVEELVRLHGFDKVPEKAPVSALTAQNKNVDVARTSKAKSILVGMGFHETVHLPFGPRDEAARMKLAESDARARAVPLANPLAEDQAVLRATLLPALLSNLSRQRAQKNLDVKIFELRSAFQWKKTGELPDEPRRLTGLLSGRRDPSGWARPADTVDFHDAKGAVEALVAALARKSVTFAASSEPFLVAGAQAAITFFSKPLGVVGEVHPDVLAAFGTHGARAFVFDLDFDLLARESGGVPTFAELPRFPAVDRDVALVVDEATEVGAMLSFARSSAKKGLESVDVFDVFRGGKLGAGKKSVALGMVWRSLEKTLTDDDVNAMHEKLVQSLEERFKATRRT